MNTNPDSNACPLCRSGATAVHVLPYPLNEKFQDEVEKVGREHFQRLLVTMGAQVASQKSAAE